MCLLDVLMNLGFQNLVVVHVNHSLRGDEADADESFVRQRAEDLGLQFHCKRVDVSALMEERSWGLEKAAREARHQVFADAQQRYDAAGVLLAHHADDQAETALYNLLRGSHGLKAMQPESHIKVQGIDLQLYRPMLGVRRDEISAYMQERALVFREDPSNAEAITARNRLRNEVMPLLGEIMQRDVVPMINASTAASLEMQGFIEAQGASLLECLDPQGRLFLPKLRSLSKLEQHNMLYQFLQRSGVKDVSRGTLGLCMGIIDPKSPHRTNLPGGGWLRRKEQRLFVEWPG